MCLAIPMRVTALEGTLATVESGSVPLNISVELVPEVKTGDYVLVHAGFAIRVVDEEEARATLDTLRQIMDSQESTP